MINELRIQGHLEIFSYEEEGFQKINLHGDPEGLSSLAKVLLYLADLDQEKIDGLPVGARMHVHLNSGWSLSQNSDFVVVGRLDSCGDKAFPSSYTKKTKPSPNLL